jgi:hypothetical protein
MRAATILFEPFSKKHLPRRANHQYVFIVAKSFGARAGKPVAGFFNLEITNRTAAAGASPPDAALVAGRRSALPSEPFMLDMIFWANSCLFRRKSTDTFPDRIDFAGTRERAGARRGQYPRSHAASFAEIGFAPEMIAPCGHAAYLSSPPDGLPGHAGSDEPAG